MNFYCASSGKGIMEKMCKWFFLLSLLHASCGIVEYFTVSEEQEAGTFVGNITRRDNFKYYFRGQVDYFKIDPDYGSIFTTTRIDREALASDDLKYIVVSSSPVYATELTIKVLDINDNAPSFKLSIVNVEILESVEVGTLIPLDGATDPDLGQNSVTSYSIVSGNGEDKFAIAIVFNLLHLKVKNKLDRELKDSYSLNVSASDSGAFPKYGYVTLNITVLDVNDNAPLFNPTTYRADIFENAPIGTSLLHINATDQDAGVNGQITYSLKDATVFVINSLTGVISLISKLDYETAPSFVLSVQALDRGNSPLAATATISVTVKDVNDNKPVIDANGASQKSLMENRVSANFMYIKASDVDFAPVTLSIVSGNKGNRFSLLFFGHGFYFLTMNVALDREEQDKYLLTLRAYDSGTPRLSSDYNVTINVLDENDNKPVFERETYYAQIQEGDPIGSYVASVRASDLDTGLNSIIEYTIANGNYYNWFQISKTTGLITTNSGAIDYDTLSSSFIILTVTATDLGSSPLHANAIVNITINKANDNTPTFNQTLYSVSVNESFPVNMALLNLTVTDVDKGMDGKVRYEFDHVSKVVAATFTLNDLTGQISLKKKLDFESIRYYSFYVLAVDNGNPQLYSKAQVQVAVTDADDNIPVFSSTDFHINAVGSSLPGMIGMFMALDVDSGVFGDIVYTIEVPGCCNYFTVNQATGMVNATRKLSAGNRYDLSITARSNGKMSKAPISVVTIDVLSQSPVFSRDEYSFHVGENSPGVFVGKLVLVGNPGIMIYSIEAGNELGYFRINDKGELFTQTGIDRERHALFVLTIIARTNQTLFLTAKAMARISIKDFNDNEPVLIKQEISGYSVREDAIVGEKVFTVFATDADYGKNGNVRYSIRPESKWMPFEIDPISGSVFVTRSLVNQSQVQYTINIDISDMGLPKQSTSVRFQINVIDINDHSPGFSSSHYDVIVNRNMSVNSRFFRLNAKDLDFGNNSKVLYEIQSGNTGNTFGIFPSGWIYLKAVAISGNIDFFSLNIIASDQGSPRKSSAARVSIFVEKSGKRIIFKSSMFRASVGENLPSGTLVTDLSSNVMAGNDIAKNISFKFFKDYSYFYIKPSTGLVTTKIVIDREAISHSGNESLVSLIIAEQNTSSGTVTESCILIVDVSDDNDNAPIFEKSFYTAVVSEASHAGTIVLNVKAIDIDSPSTSSIVYEIRPAHLHFSIDSLTGAVRVASSVPKLDYEANKTHNFTVVALDSKNSSLSSSCQVVIYITDQNDNKPVFVESTTSLSVSESTIVGSHLFTFSATDSDSGMNGFVTYSLLSSDGKNLFKINEYSGEMYLAGLIDFETKSSYHITITANDHGTPALKETIAVSVTIADFNDNAPKFNVEPSTLFVTENIPSPHVIGKCSASDADSGLNKVIRYTIAAQGPVSGMFTVNSNDCQISTNAPLDRETISTYYIVIKAEDSAENAKDRLSVRKNLTIVVEDTNDNVPVFVPPFAAGFSRTPGTGWEIIKVSAIDIDAGLNGTVSYAINQKWDSASFVMNTVTGSVTVISPLANDRKTFQIEVKASDKGSKEQKHSTALFHFFVTGTSSNAPVCSGTGQATIYENLAVGTNVYRVQAVSTEANSQMMYFIKSGSVGNSFVVDPSSGWVSIGRSIIDFDTGLKMFDIRVFAVENAGSVPKTTECTVRINIQDLNDNAPVFASLISYVSVSENVTIGHEVYQVSATDKDTGQHGVIDFAITNGNTQSTFTIHASTGIVKLAKSLNRELMSSYILTIEASNKGSQKSYAQLRVEVSDVNDNVPTFNQAFYSFTVPESSPSYSFVGTVKATDADSGRNKEIYYEIINSDQSTFTIDHTTGVIRIASSVDYELVPNFMFTVRAIDYGAPRLSSTVAVFVNIQDTNDNCPVFSNTVYTAEISENLSPGFLVTKISATDKDSGLNGQVTYEIVDGNIIDSFSSSANGDVSTKRMLDREETSSFKLLLRAEDRGAIKERNCLSYATLTIKVLDVNDNKPVLNQPHVIRILESSSVGAIVYKFTATDRDYGINSTVKFSFVEPNDLDRIFRLSENGNLLLLSRLDYEAKKEYSVNVSVSNLGSPPLASISKVTISIQDANDNNPIIGPHPALISILENATIGSTVMEFSATDLDSGDNARITFSIISGNLGGVFNIEPASGILYLESALNREERATYLVEVEAKDNGLPQRRGITSLNISLIDVNDCSPKFQSPNYSVSVLENVIVGDILTLQAFDCDTGSNAFLRYNLENSLFADKFTINPTTGTITVLQALDREVLDVVRLTVTARDNGNPSLTGKTTVLVYVLDENDNFPIIIPRNVTKTVRENLNGDIEVQQFRITDADFGLNSTLDVNLMNDFGSFRLAQVGNVYTIKTIGGLDRELQEIYKLEIKASDRGVQKKTSVAYLYLYVGDDNDSPPVFSKKRYEFKIPSNAPAGSFVAQLTTTDKDTPINSNMQFSIISGNDSYVSISADTGIILTKMSLPLKMNFEIGVQVSDPSKPLFKDNTVVGVETATGYPTFTHGELYGVVSETSPVGTFVQNVRATSSAIGPAATIRYYIHVGNAGLAFSIDSTTGNLYVNNPLDYETRQAYSLWIEARDSENPPQSSYVKVVLTVKNENDSAPVITGPKTDVLFMENQGSNAYVTQVVAVDVDNPTSRTRLRFKLGGSAVSLPFSIDPINGKVRSTKSLNREEIASYQLEVVVYPFENSSLTSAYNLSILVQDDNDNKPVVHSPNRISIPENLAVNTKVMLLNVTDKDAGGNGLLTFSLISNTFRIDSTTGSITLIKSLDRETQEVYSLSIKIEDAIYQTIHQLTIAVTDINDSPPYFLLSRISVNVSESTPVGSAFGQVSAMDKDIGDNAACFYHIEPRSGHGYISVDPLSGSLMLKRRVQFVKNQSALNTLEFVLKARNIYSPFYTAQTKLLIQVLDANDHSPVFSQSSYYSYVESVAAIGHIVTTVSAVDDHDAGQNAALSYTILSGNGTNALMLSGDNIKVKASLTSFVNSVLQLVVQAADSGSPIRASTALVNVKVTEENRHSPVFAKAKFEVTVPENKQLFKELIKVVALDQDSGDNGLLLYSIKSGNTDNAFAIGMKSGSLYLAKPLDFEKTSTYQLVIEARDSAKVKVRASTVIVDVRVTNVNDNRPVFASKVFAATVVENKPSNTQVTKVIATDADSSDTISYDISDPISRVYFTINSNTGIIKTRTGIDYETNQNFTVIVTASDSGSPVLTSSVNVIITVIGVNEYRPQFVKKAFDFNVSQYASVDTIIGNISAVDNDKGIDGVVVFLPGFSIEYSPFQLDIASGNLLVKQPLTIGHYVLPVFVKNVMKINLTPSDIDQATIYVNVLKGNEPPVFTPASYVASVEENSPAGQLVTIISARDNDGGAVVYTIEKQLPSKAFNVDPTNGRITVSGQIDRERTQQYDLTVQAIDNGSPPAVSTTKVRVTILDRNDNQPVIVNCSGSIFENATIGEVVTKLSVTDNDIDPNRGPFTYQTSSGDFSVSSTGELRVAGPLDREKISLHNITIDITDNGSPAQRSSGHCLINVIDVSDVKATKRNAVIIFNSLGPYASGGLIGNLSPNDPDHSDSYTCAIEAAHSVFHFEPSSCILHLASHRDIGYKTINFTAKSHNTELRDTASFNFVQIINSTVNKTLVLRLQGFSQTVLEFTNNTLLQLNQFLESISPTSTSIRAIGYKQQDTRTLDLLLAALDKQSSNSLPVTAAMTIISSNTVQLLKITGSSAIDVPFKACVKENLCQNNGTCYEFRSIDSHNTIWNSVGLIFVGVSFQATFACKCKPGFYGPRCEKIISSCTPNPCQNGGTCEETNSGDMKNSSCSCHIGYTGKYCENDINECVNSPCKNSGTCMNTPGSYYCQCGAKYTGKNCDTIVNFCLPNPCLFGGTCIPNDASFTCNCNYGNQGKYCEINPMTFDSLSYLSFTSFPNHPLNVSVDFATYDNSSLLLYGFNPTMTGAKSPFIGFELVNGHIRFSWNFGAAVKRSSIESNQVADGYWHTASFYLSGQKLSLQVDKVTSEVHFNEATQTPDLQGAPLYIAGVPSIDAILQRHNQISADDFTGCMRNIHINGYHVDKSTALTSNKVTSGCSKAIGCSDNTCKYGQCISDWNGFQCQCNSGFAGDTCSADAKPFTFGGTSFVMFQMKESYRRKLKMAMSISSLRRRRSIFASSQTTNSFSIEFRTRNPNGLLLYAEDVGGNFTVLHISNGGIHYKFNLKGGGSGATAIEKPLVTDGKWHNISLIVNDNKVSLSLDNNQATQNSFSVSPHRFYSIYTNTLSIAGTTTPKSVDGKTLMNFIGCLNAMSLNNENLAITTTNKFNVTTVGSTMNNCDGSNVCVPNPCRDPVKSYCIDEWEAYRCIDPGKCKTQPCKNGGTCIPTESGFTCNCVGNFTGSACETPLICLQSPCKTGEICISNLNTVFQCVPIVADKEKTLSTSEVVMIVVFTLIGCAFIFVIIFFWRKRQPHKKQKFKGDFVEDGQEMELKHTAKPARFGSGSFQRNRPINFAESTREVPQNVITFDNEAYQNDMTNDVPNVNARKSLSTSQPSIQPPRSHRTQENGNNVNRSLPILSYKGDQNSEQRRNERILHDLRGPHFTDHHIRDLDLEVQARRSSERLMEIPISSKLGTATPPFESGFESTGSDMDSERDQASVTDIVDGSSQLEMYDLEVASIGFSEMSWQNDNNSSGSRDIRRDFIDKRLDRLRHLMPQFNMYDYGSMPSDRHARSDRVSDRLSDLVEQDSSSDSDGSFTGSEYEYGDERISTNKLNRKHLVFSRHPQTSDSEADGSVMQRRHSSDSSITNMTDVGSIQPVREQGSAPRLAMPPIDWDQLLNWAMKYENLSDVYRALATLRKDEGGESPRVSSARSSGRRKREQKHSQPSVKFHSAQELHQSEEYV